MGDGFLESRRDRFVTVKGLAERDVEADLALWPFQIMASAFIPGTVRVGSTIEYQLD